MAKSCTVFIILFLSLLSISFAQKIIFAEKIDSLGNFSACQNTYQIDLVKGSKVVLIFQSNQAIPKPKLYAFIDKKESNGTYKEFDTYRIGIEKDSTKMAYCSYLFTKEGSYRVAFADVEKKEISHAFLSISFKTNIVFCEQIDSVDLPIDYKNKFKLKIKGGIDIYSFIKTSSPMNCSSISHTIYKYNGKDYSSLLSSDKFAVKADWEYTYIKSNYRESGKYKIVIGTNTNKVLGVNYLEIIK